MEIGGSAGSQAAQSLMQANQKVNELSTKQLQAVSNQMSEVKATALQNSAEQVSSTVGRKGSVIDNMA
ncbi:MAG: hypothetical protein OEX03_12640 [Gammaproteobacteria bacterium]|nr:hypothetical protein [Gammaproteobacteria bacterium]